MARVSVDCLVLFYPINEAFMPSSCVWCAFSGRMACCIINVLVSNSQQGNSADTLSFKDKHLPEERQSGAVRL